MKAIKYMFGEQEAGGMLENPAFLMIFAHCHHNKLKILKWGIAMQYYYLRKGNQ
jgi:hypothetical protein